MLDIWVQLCGQTWKLLLIFITNYKKNPTHALQITYGQLEGREGLEEIFGLKEDQNVCWWCLRPHTSSHFLYLFCLSLSLQTYWNVNLIMSATMWLAVQKRSSNKNRFQEIHAKLLHLNVIDFEETLETPGTIWISKCWENVIVQLKEFPITRVLN